MEKKGINISIDDFGTGYSSLTYLKRFDLYSLKIDRSFVQDIPADTEDMAIISAVISLAGSLDMRTVAEGVESREQLEFLRSKGCTEIQGYYLSRPLAADDVAAFLGNGYTEAKA
ncbi:EAL domain-containing protein [Oxalobacter aliiformigenes]|nr:EAL domain-containing protein [Oxalobacter aliiformigenes]WAV96187.1 EAL domain-containing protein [Oxalobacter aliiformigenes]